MKREKDPDSTNQTVEDRRARNRLKCAVCPPNRGENSKRKPRPDKHKEHRATSIAPDTATGTDWENERGDFE